MPCATSRLAMPCELATVLGCVECFAQRMGAVDRAAHRRHWAERRIAIDHRASTGAPLNRPAASFGPRAGQTADHAARTVVTGHRREVCRGRSARRSKAVVPVVRCANECRAALLARTVESRRRFKRAGLKSLRQRLDRTGCGRTRAQGRRGIAKESKDLQSGRREACRARPAADRTGREALRQRRAHRASQGRNRQRARGSWRSAWPLWERIGRRRPRRCTRKSRRSERPRRTRSGRLGSDWFGCPFRAFHGLAQSARDTRSADDRRAVEERERPRRSPGAHRTPCGSLGFGRY